MIDDVDYISDSLDLDDASDDSPGFGAGSPGSKTVVTKRMSTGETDSKDVIIQTTKPDNNLDQVVSDKDFAFARSNFRKVIGVTNEAIDGIMLVATESEHPRAYEVLAQMLKTSADVTKELAIMHKMKADMKTARVAREGSIAQRPNDQTGSQTNNIVFAGSAAELQSMLKELKENI